MCPPRFRADTQVCLTIMTMPWKWFGMTTCSSISDSGNLFINSYHHRSTISPASFNRISLSAISQNINSRLCAQTERSRNTPQARNNRIRVGGKNGAFGVVGADFKPAPTKPACIIIAHYMHLPTIRSATCTRSTVRACCNVPH